VRTVPRRSARHTTVRLTGPDGVTYQGDGDGFAAAVRDLVRHHPNGPAAGREEVRWRLTPQGEAYLAGLRDGTQRRAGR
jgi:hypothetical protein